MLIGSLRQYSFITSWTVKVIAEVCGLLIVIGISIGPSSENPLPINSILSFWSLTLNEPDEFSTSTGNSNSTFCSLQAISEKIIRLFIEQSPVGTSPHGGISTYK